ncbi:MAG: DUF2285 domain-containing protein [Alphaproteobacteria bacterium]|nr:DUF2285 domain-containing protein [Alphaproteobacteria bacterium]MBL6938205.1 DUF2285 domain-containing protein [Alphaproteobacteria bacterium]MBL7097261.1 DUF2285 domain-containing protein [Alphaproteobacteria bacterium]
MRCAGGCDFAKSVLDARNPVVLWTMTALPTVIPLGSLPAALGAPRTHPTTFQRSWIRAQDGSELQIVCNATALRVHALDSLESQPVCAILPVDVLFDVRLAAARRLWLAASGRNPGPDPATLSPSQRDRLVKALRALDGRLEGATYREIAVALFGTKHVHGRGWKTHDLRDRTIRLCDLGANLMAGGYRQLLLHPFRQRLY